MATFQTLKMKTLLSMLLILQSLACFGQLQYEREWSKGPLTWDDFQAESPIGETAETYLYYQLSYAKDKKKIGKHTYEYLRVKSTINPYRSWVTEEGKKPQLLRYNQILFDLVELCRRNIQYQLNGLEDFSYVNLIFDEEYKKCEQEMNGFSEAVSHGEDIDALAAWNIIIQKRLAETENTQEPKYDYRNLGLFLGLGIGTTVYFGNISEQFQPLVNFLRLDYTFRFKNLELNFGGMLGQAKVKRTFTFEGEQWSEHDTPYITQTDISLSYADLLKKDFGLSPFIGVSFFTSEDGSKEESNLKKFRLTNMIVGLSYKFANRFTVTQTSSIDGCGSEIRMGPIFRLYLSNASDGIMKGYMLHTSISYSFGGRFLNMK
ncbi:hypothetical protein BC781_102792 [Sediminitomix flava]|uniref:Outer membrane protein with beta-barrel domain n=2 Tax=Sediminitomix flava TaxID=379075 RepID=A0A315ZDP0_SEDFL|nr:hypothetical protein BC781_102792 [Sediminitomix flava]